MKAQSSSFVMPSEWQDPRPPLPWGRWLLGLALVSALVLLTTSVGQRLVAPAPPVPLSIEASVTRELSRLVEESRGGESLYVMLESASDRRALQGKLTAGRGRLSALVAKAQANATHATEQHIVAELDEALLAWWAAQDQVFQALQSRVISRDDAGRARLLLTVDSQHSFHRLLNIIDRWVAWQAR